MKRSNRSIRLAPFILSALLLSSSFSCRKESSDPHIVVSVKNDSVFVISAVTMYDSDPEARNAFLNWFERGFKTAMTGKPPMYVTWEDSPEGEAKRMGYDLGLEEGDKMRRDPDTRKSKRRIPIPPG